MYACKQHVLHIIRAGELGVRSKIRLLPRLLEAIKGSFRVNASVFLALLVEFASVFSRK